MGANFGDVLGAFLGFMGIIFIILYVFGCFINYRIVAKFEPEIGFGQNLIPLWNYYLLIRAAVNKPVLYFWAVILVAVIFAFIGGVSESSSISLVGQIICIALMANVVGSIAKKLDKSYWLFFILSIIPIVNFVMMLILAFDSSRPVAVAAEPDSAQQLI